APLRRRGRPGRQRCTAPSRGWGSGRGDRASRGAFFRVVRGAVPGAVPGSRLSGGRSLAILIVARGAGRRVAARVADATPAQGAGGPAEGRTGPAPCSVPQRAAPPERSGQ